VALDICFR